MPKYEVSFIGSFTIVADDADEAEFWARSELQDNDYKTLEITEVKQLNGD